MEVIKLKTEDGEILLNVYDDSEKDYQNRKEELENTLDLSKVVKNNVDE